MEAYHNYDSPRGYVFTFTNGSVITVNRKDSSWYSWVYFSNVYVYKINFYVGVNINGIEFFYDRLLYNDRSSFLMSNSSGTLNSFSIEELNSDLKKFDLLGFYGTYYNVYTTSFGVFYG